LANLLKAHSGLYHWKHT